jgi:hypothetical protein
MSLTLNLLTTIIVAPPSNATKWQVGFNSAFKGLKSHTLFSQMYIYGKGLHAATSLCSSITLHNLSVSPVRAVCRLHFICLA